MTLNWMLIIHDLESVQLSGVVLTIGNFDGVHLGHQAMLTAGRRYADRERTRLVVMTFDPHPSAVLNPLKSPPTLSPLSDKLYWLEKGGVDVAVVVKATPDFLAMSAESFLKRIILTKFRPMAMVEGASFGFGHKRQGDVHTLIAAGSQYGFKVEVVEPIRIGLGGHPDTVISSSLIRQLIMSGTVDRAALCLGRPYTLFGTVAHGVGRGGSIGYPTVNLNVADQLVPAEGVYAGRTKVNGRPFTAAISIGYSPTFKSENLSIEAYLIGFKYNIYGQPINLQFLEWLRDQVTFPSIETLQAQIQKDVLQTQAIMQKYTG